VVNEPIVTRNVPSRCKEILEFSREVAAKDDLCGPRRAVLHLWRQLGITPTRPFDAVQHFKIKPDNGGMAFPEVLRSYGDLFHAAAEHLEIQAEQQAAESGH
jgi:hypothetical protein